MEKHTESKKPICTSFPIFPATANIKDLCNNILRKHKSVDVTIFMSCHYTQIIYVDTCHGKDKNFGKKIKMNMYNIDGVLLNITWRLRVKFILYNF